MIKYEIQVVKYVQYLYIQLLIILIYRCFADHDPRISNIVYFVIKLYGMVNYNH